MISLSDETALRGYIKQKGLVSAGQAYDIEYLRGGVSCEVVRVKTADREFVIKQALPKLRVKEDWFSDISRIIVEKDCLAVYNSLIPDDVPKLLFADEDNYLFGMEAAPSSAEMWKQQLLRGDINFAIGEKVATALGTVHNAAARSAEIRERFASQELYIQLRIDPYFVFTAARHPDLKPAITREIERILSTKITLVHGDYSPKNILVAKDRLFILDFEVAHYGDPAFDLGFLTNHLMLKAIKNKQWAPAYMNLMNVMVNRYLSLVDFTDARQLEANTVRTLALLFLARVDGKSPAEYITEDTDKRIIRAISYQLIKDNFARYNEVSALTLETVKKL